MADEVSILPRFTFFGQIMVLRTKLENLAKITKNKKKIEELRVERSS